MNEFPVGRFYRCAKVLEIDGGTSEVQRMLTAWELGLGLGPGSGGLCPGRVVLLGSGDAIAGNPNEVIIGP